MKRGIAADALKIIGAVLGLGVACVACCALPTLVPLLAGILAGSALAGVAFHAAGSAIGAAAIGAAVLLLHRRRRKANRAAIQDRCGCSEPERAKEPASGAGTALSRSQILSPSQPREPASS